jgi:uncharacterized membrane protein YccC
MPPARDWFYGVRTFAASMIALYIALLMQMPRPYWAMATVYIVSSPFVGPTSSKALYRAIGTFLGAAAAVCSCRCSYRALCAGGGDCLVDGILLFLSLHLRTANNYALMLAGYTLPLIALPTVDNPLAVWDVAEARTEEIFLGIAVAAVVGAMFWPGGWPGVQRFGEQMVRRCLDLQPAIPRSPCSRPKPVRCVRRWWPPSTAWN